MEGRGREAGTNKPHRRTCVLVFSLHAPLEERGNTHLQMLNKTSLCQTIQGRAGHSLCGGGGVRRRPGTRREG